MFNQKEWLQIFCAAGEKEQSCILKAMLNSSKDNPENMPVEGLSKISETFIKPEDFHDIPSMILPEEAVSIEEIEALFEEKLTSDSPKVTAIDEVFNSVKSQGESSSKIHKSPLDTTTSQSSQEIDFDIGQLDEIFSQKSQNEEPFERRKGYSSSYEENNPQPPIRMENPKRFVPQKSSDTSKSSWMKKNLTQTNERSTYREPFLRTNSPNEYERRDEPKKPKTDFITARKELQVQNLINYGKDSRSSVSGGGRRVGLRKPVAPKNDFPEEESKKKDKTSDDELCDQLSHIDPKIIEMIRNEIMMKVPVIDWKDIIGLTYAKSVIQEAIVMPMLRPDIFTGLRRPPRGILLFGPPGTGKTLIGKCIASRANATFFNISASTLTSKYIGEGEKMVRGLFAVASAQQPSVIFIDEIDSLLCQRSESEHESSRRLKTEFLIHLDGAATNENELVLVVGATNRPQELDEAVRRRFVKRLYIPLPILEARLEMVKSLFSKVANNLSANDMISISQLTDGFSGADMKSLCQEASMGPIRSIPIEQFHDFSNSDLRPVNFQDFQTAMQCVRASVSPEDIENYLKWDKVYGSGGRST